MTPDPGPTTVQLDLPFDRDQVHHPSAPLDLAANCPVAYNKDPSPSITGDESIPNFTPGDHL